MDNELRDALRRVEPPHGFAERVIAKADADVDNVRLKPDATNVAAKGWGWAVAAMLAVTIAGGLWHRADEQRRGEEARRQVLVSLNIAGSKLRAVQMKINHEQER